MKNTAMIPFKDRQHKLYSISIRDISLAYQPYILKIEGNDKVICSAPTNHTMLPKFELDRTNKELATYLLNTRNPELKVELLTIEQKKMFEITTDLSTLKFINKDLSKGTDLQYPVLLFEFSSGFYSAKQFSDQPTTISSVSSDIKSINSFQYLEKFQQAQGLGIEVETKANHILTDTHSELFIELEKRYQIELKKIEKQRLTEKIKQLKKKKELYELTIATLKKAIDEKVRDLNIGTNSYEVNKQNLAVKQQKYEKDVSNLKKYKIINTAFVNKKLLEIAYFFFNKDINGYFYHIPPFFNMRFETASVNETNARYEDYSKHCKSYAGMMGHIALLINYFSKTFNIPLKYSMFVNGSKSFCVKDKDVFLTLYADPHNNEERHLKFDKALICLQGNLREIVNYLSIYQDSFPDIKKEAKDMFDKNLFYSFVQFNQLIYKFMEKQRVFEEIFSN